MRIALIAFAMLLLLGCIQQLPAKNITATGTHAPANSTGNQESDATAAAENQTLPAHNQPVTENESGMQNITPASMPLLNESNITVPNVTAAANLGNGTNATSPNAANVTAQPSALSFGNYSLVLDDISVVSSPAEPCGIFSIHAMNGSILDRFVLCPPQSRTWLAPDDHVYRIVVEKVAAGYEGKGSAEVLTFG